MSDQAHSHDPDDGSVTITCEDCGNEHRVSAETWAAGEVLSRYARGTRVYADRLVWLQAVAGDDGPYEAGLRLLEVHDRSAVAAFLRGEFHNRRTRRAWRAVATTLGVRAPFDVRGD